MKIKKIISATVLLALAFSMWGCAGEKVYSDIYVDKETERVLDGTSESEEASGAATAGDSEPLPDDTDVVTEESFKEPYVPSEEHEYVFPKIVTAHTTTGPAIWERKVDLTVCIIDQDGNELCDALYSGMYLASPGYYVVLRQGDDGKTYYGLLSVDGSRFTGTVYTGCSCMWYLDSRSDCIYMSTYEGDTMLLTCYDTDMNVVFENRELKADRDGLGLAGDNINIHTLFDNDRALIKDEHFADYGRVTLVDTKTGKVLGKVDCNYVFGNMIVGGISDIELHDTDGNELYSGVYDYSRIISEDRLMLANKEKVDIFDLDGNIVATMELKGNSRAFGSLGYVEVDNADGSISVYDTGLEFLYKVDDVSSGFGLCLLHHRDKFETDPIYDNISDKMLYDLKTGRSISTGEYSYSLEHGYLCGDNSGYAYSVSTYCWKILDLEFDTVLEGKGEMKLIEDVVTHRIYALNYRDDGKTRVYDMESKELIYTVDSKMTQGVVMINGMLTDMKCKLYASDGSPISVTVIEQEKSSDPGFDLDEIGIVTLTGGDFEESEETGES